jgi:hypothetical protein
VVDKRREKKRNGDGVEEEEKIGICDVFKVTAHQEMN